MNLHLHRDVFTDTATLGILTVDGKSFGFTCEDPPRDVKIKKITCIPAGKYRVKRTFSPKYNKLMMLVCDVPGFRGIRIHPGNDAGDTEGCILPGLTRDVSAMTVGKSTLAWGWLDKEVAKVESAGGEVWIEIS